MKAKRMGGRLRTTVRVALAFVAVMLILQMGFTAVYLFRNSQLTREAREQSVSLYESAVTGYYDRAVSLVDKLLSESHVIEMGHRDAITQANYKKIYSTIRLLKECASANEGDFDDLFIYFPRADKLYSQNGLCQRTNSQAPRYVSLDVSALAGAPAGEFFAFGQRIVSGSRAYACNIVGRVEDYAAVFVTCPLAALTELSDVALRGSAAEAAFLDEDGNVRAASSALSGVGGDALSSLSGDWRAALRSYTFQNLPLADGSIVVGFSRQVPSESVRRNNVMVLIVNTACLAMIAAYLLLFGRRVYMPLKRIAQQADSGDDATADDEFMRISAYIDTISGELNDYQDKYSRSQHENQLNRLAMALQDEGDATPMASESDYAIISVVCEDDGREDRALSERIERKTLAQWSAKPMSRQNGQVLYYITLPEGGVPAVAEALKAQLADTPALISISGGQRNLRLLHQAMEEARVALLRQAPDIAEGELRVCLYGEACKVSLFSGLAVRSESTLAASIESGNLDSCLQQLEGIFRENERGSVFQQRDLCLFLLNTLLRGRPQGAEDVAPIMLRVKATFRFPDMRAMVIAQYERALKLASQENALLSRIQDFITRSFGLSDLSLQMVADHVGLSYSYLSKFIKQTTGVGFADYVTHLRIDEAKRMLAGTDMLVGEISAAVGFSVFSSFSRAFKKCTGISPSEYKKLYAGTAEAKGDGTAV